MPEMFLIQRTCALGEVNNCFKWTITFVSRPIIEWADRPYILFYLILIFVERQAIIHD